MKAKNFDVFHKIDDAKNLVIFIHGFTGTHDTWQMQDGDKPFINQLLCNNTISSTYNFAMYRYTSQLFGKKPTGLLKRALSEVKRKFSGEQKYFNLNFEDITSNLKSEINLYREENNLEYVNLFFISHSMGGIIVKNFICDIYKLNKYKLKQYHSIHVPHRGSELAMLIPKNIQSEGLLPNSDILIKIEKKWLEANYRKLPKTFYYVGLNQYSINK